MHIPLTVYNVLEQKLRSLLAMAGIAFAVLLVFMQVGFFETALKTATFLLDNLNFDIAVVSSEYIEINRPGAFRRRRVYQALGVDGVQSVTPVYVSAHFWRIQKDQKSEENLVPFDPSQRGFQRGIMVVAFPLGTKAFRNEDVRRNKHKLTKPGTVLIDRSTRHFFGKRKIGIQTELGEKKVRIVDSFEVGTGYGADGMVITSDQTFGQVFGGRALDYVQFGLIKLHPEADPVEVAKRLRKHLNAPDLHVITREKLLRAESMFWVASTSIGIIFGVGVVVALAVGGVFIYQVLSTDIGKRFNEYATLKALGYTNGYLSWLVVQQALVYAVLGYLPGLVIATFLYWQGYKTQNLPLEMDLPKIAGVFGLTILMALISALFAVRKVQNADPADLF